MAKAKAKAKKTNNPAVYKVIEIVGTSPNSFADAAKSGIKIASKSLRDLRVAEIIQQDVKIESGKLVFRAKMKVSFKYHGDD